VATYTHRVVTVIKKQVILPSPSNMTELTKALTFVNKDLEARGIKYYDDIVTVESFDGEIVIWYDVSNTLTEDDEKAVRAAVAAARGVRHSLPRVKASPPPQDQPLPSMPEPVIPEGDLPELTKDAATKVAGASGTTYFHLPSDQKDIAKVRARMRTAVNQVNRAALLETRVIRNPRPALEVTIVH